MRQLTSCSALLGVGWLVLGGLAGCDDGSRLAKSDLSISLAGTAQASTLDGAALSLSDKVKAALTADARLNNAAIGVKAAQGVVTLYGTVDTSANRDRAARIAYTVEGTRYVKSNLMVTSGR